MGLATIVMGLTSNDVLAVAAAVVIGIFNLVYVIPSQTLFAERTPTGLMGRVVAMRSSIVMGALTGSALSMVAGPLRGQVQSLLQEAVSGFLGNAMDRGRTPSRPGGRRDARPQPYSAK